MRTRVAAIEERFMHDPRFPYFRIINPNNKTGMDNPDQRYLIAILDGNHDYRVWGSRGTSRRLDFVLFADVVDGRTLGVLSSDDLVVGEVPHMNAAVMTQRLRALAAAFSEQVRHWPEFNMAISPGR